MTRAEIAALQALRAKSAQLVAAVKVERALTCVAYGYSTSK